MQKAFPACLIAALVALETLSSPALADYGFGNLDCRVTVPAFEAGAMGEHKGSFRVWGDLDHARFELDGWSFIFQRQFRDSWFVDLVSIYEPSGAGCQVFLYPRQALPFRHYCAGASLVCN